MMIIITAASHPAYQIRSPLIGLDQEILEEGNDSQETKEQGIFMIIFYLGIDTDWVLRHKSEEALNLKLKSSFFSFFFLTLLWNHPLFYEQLVILNLGTILHSKPMSDEDRKDKGASLQERRRVSFNSIVTSLW